jgi:hypothetical protein
MARHVRQLMDLNAFGHLRVGRMFHEDVIFDFVVRHEAQLAVWTLARLVLHASIVGCSAVVTLGSSVPAISFAAIDAAATSLDPQILELQRHPALRGPRPSRLLRW